MAKKRTPEEEAIRNQIISGAKPFSNNVVDVTPTQAPSTQPTTTINKPSTSQSGETKKPKNVVLPKLPTGNLIIDGKEVTQEENARMNRRANSVIGINEAYQQRQDEINAQQNANMPFVQPPPIDTNTNLPKVDLLDVGSITAAGIGGAGTGAGVGAAIGSIVPGLGTAAGAVAGGLIGGLGAAGTALFFSNAGEQKQFTKLQFTDFTQSTRNAERILNNANARVGSPQQNRVNMENEIARIEQAQINLEKQSEKLFGAKLSANQDERAKIEAWIRMWNSYGNAEFQMALANPNPQLINQNIAVPDEIMQ